MRWGFLIVLLCVSGRVFCQDTLADSTPQHSVKKAVIFSAVIPGSGQIYNHLAMPKGRKNAYWKVPLIYAGLGATGYLALQKNSLKNDYRTEYESRKSGNVPVLFENYDDEALLTLYSSSRNQRDLFIIGFGIVYLLNVLDAGVEAHFVSFDVSEDLSLHFQPSFSGNAVGFGATLKFR
jgi:hypothetical protein